MRSSLYQGPLTIFCIIAFFLVSALETRAQFDSLGLNTEWRKGTIMLEDNSALKGLIQYNDKLGLIKFKKTRAGEEVSFVETSIVAMQLFDDDLGEWRNFAVFNIKEEETGRQGTLLFEVLMEFEHFALLTRVEKVNIGARQRQDAFGNIHTVRVGYEQFEKLCLVNEEGTATLILAVNEFDRRKLSMASKVPPYLNKRALKEYLSEDWDKFQALVKSNKLNLTKRDDFIRAFEYYKEMKAEGL